MAIEPFNFQTPTRVNFGLDTACGVGEIVVELGGSKVLFVTDSFLLKSGLAKKVIDSLAAAGLSEPVVFSDVPPDSELTCVQSVVALARQEGCDCVVALGGGSVIDTAKVANIGITFESDILEFEGINNLPSRLRPMLVLPTTAGTGSEVSAVAMVKDSVGGKKLLFGSRFLFADVAVLDPGLLVSLPVKLTGATGLDAVTHCIEAYVSATANVVSDGLALESLSMLFEALPRAVADGNDIEARGATLLASMMAGLAFTNAGVGVVHALAHTIGGQYGTHHGATNAVFLPHGMQFNMSVAYKKYANIWRRLTVSGVGGNGQLAPTYDGDDHKAAEALLGAVRELIGVCKLQTTLKELGVPALAQEDFTELASTAMTDPAIMFNPKEASLEDLIEILKLAY